MNDEKIKPYLDKNNITIYHGCALEVLKQMENESVDMVMTSPPYWGLRDYGEDGQLGLEPTYQEYIEKLVAIFDEVKRVLKDTGSIWVNLGDSYSSSGAVGGGKDDYGATSLDYVKNQRRAGKTDIIPKSLIGIPERFAIAMTDAGWIRRNTIIWYKPNCMPSSASDRFTVDFEYLYFFSKKPQYYFEQQIEPNLDTWGRWGKYTNPKMSECKTGSMSGAKEMDKEEFENKYSKNGRNKRCVWQLSTESYPDAHFATYPEKLCETPIKAGCPKDGVVMDPFAGSFTTLKVARELGRKGIGIELNEEYIKMGIKRMKLNQSLLQFNNPPKIKSQPLHSPVSTRKL